MISSKPLKFTILSGEETYEGFSDKVRVLYTIEVNGAENPEGKPLPGSCRYESLGVLTSCTHPDSLFTAMRMFTSLLLFTFMLPKVSMPLMYTTNAVLSPEEPLPPGSSSPYSGACEALYRGV